MQLVVGRVVYGQDDKHTHSSSWIYSHTDISCVDRTRYLLVIGAFNDGACIGKLLVVLAARGTIGLTWQLDAITGIFPDIHPDHRSAYLLALEHYFERFGGGNTGNSSYNAIQHAGGIAGGCRTRERHFRED